MTRAQPPRPGYTTALVRGLRKRCPRCGEGDIFRGWYTMNESCDRCELEYEAGEGDTWAFMYLSTGGITGLFIVVMLLIRPATMQIGQGVVALAALVLIVGTLPRRKGTAIALDYLTRRARRDAGKS